MADTVYTVNKCLTSLPDKELLESLKRSVGQICRRDGKIDEFYIGIASGASPVEAMKHRNDRRTKYDFMRALYESKSQDHVKEVESALIEHFKDHQGNLNMVGGGGGRFTSKGFCYVYLAGYYKKEQQWWCVIL